MVYVLRSDGSYMAFEGMKADAVTSMLSNLGFTCTFIDEATYLAAQRPGR